MPNMTQDEILKLRAKHGIKPIQPLTTQPTEQNDRMRMADDIVASRGANVSATETEQPVEEKKSFLKKAGEFFTGSTQKFAETLGTAMSVIDPKTRKLRDEVIGSTNQQVDDLMKLARSEKDKEKATRLLDAAQKLANTEDIDIFNNEEYQKTVKQIFGEGAGVALETLGWGKVGGLTKGVKVATVGQTALKGVTTGGVLGSGFSASQALQDNKSMEDVLKEGLKGGVLGAVTGGILGYGAGKLAGKIGTKQATKLVSPKLTSAERELAIRQGRLKGKTLLRSEKYIPSKTDKELGKLAQEVGLKGDDASRDAVRATKVIETEANKLKARLKETGAIYNRNTIKGQLNKMKADKTADLIDAETKVYDKMITKFNKLGDQKKNKGLDGLLEIRQEFDAWAKSNNPNIFENKRGGAYRALTAVRDTINDYINTQVGDDVVKASLKKQSNLYKIIENIAEKGATNEGKLQPSKLRVGVKKLLPWAGGAVGLKVLENTINTK
jgi:hypothetical protein